MTENLTIYPPADLLKRKRKLVKDGKLDKSVLQRDMVKSFEAIIQKAEGQNPPSLGFNNEATDKALTDSGFKPVKPSLPVQQPVEEDEADVDEEEGKPTLTDTQRLELYGKVLSATTTRELRKIQASFPEPDWMMLTDRQCQAIEARFDQLKDAEFARATKNIPIDDGEYEES